MAKQRRLREVSTIQEVVTPILDTFIQPRKKGKNSLDKLVEALGAAAPGIEALTKAGIVKEAKKEAQKGGQFGMFEVVTK